MSILMHAIDIKCHIATDRKTGCLCPKLDFWFQFLLFGFTPLLMLKDRQTDGRTHDDSIYSAIIELRGQVAAPKQSLLSPIVYLV